MVLRMAPALQLHLAIVPWHAVPVSSLKSTYVLSPSLSAASQNSVFNLLFCAFLECQQRHQGLVLYAITQAWHGHWTKGSVMYCWTACSGRLWRWNCGQAYTKCIRKINILMAAALNSLRLWLPWHGLFERNSGFARKRRQIFEKCQAAV